MYRYNHFGVLLIYRPRYKILYLKSKVELIMPEAPVMFNSQKIQYYIGKTCFATY